MSKSPLKRSGSKHQTADANDAARHATKKRKLTGELLTETPKKPTHAKSKENLMAMSIETPTKSSPAQTPKSVVEQSAQKDLDGDKKKRTKSKSKVKAESRGRWEVTSGSGGRFLALDPIFDANESHLILATKAVVQVYSTSTSLLVRSLVPMTDSPITTYVLSPTDPDILYIGTFSGQITKWNWQSGVLLSTIAGPPELLGLVPAPAEATEEYTEFLYTIHRSGEKMKTLSIVRVGDSSKPQIHQTLLERKSLSRNMYLSTDGKVLVLSAGQKLIFGAVHLLAKAKGESKTPTFREITLPEDVSSIDVRERSKSASTKPQDPALDIAIGTRRGPILVYDDAYGRLLAKERQRDGSAPVDMIPRRMHWHRDMVNAVKWSRDGNYIISGGKETVLVIWQLDTSQKQYLPHLSAEITNITVSPAGTSYSIQLTNNTNIVLATSELRPTASMSGLDIPKDIQAYRKDKKVQRKPGKLVAAISSSRPEEILLVSSSMLQTFDTRTLQNIARQALTRNNITNINVNPSGSKIQDPVITHMAVSHDGSWMATVDEWSPSEQDLDPIHPAGSVDATKKEVYLKFWRYDPTDKQWELSARIDGPHSEESTKTGSVFELRCNPARLEFATTGDDGNVKLWSPKARVRDGHAVKDKNGRRLLDWSCRYVLHPGDSILQTPAEATLAFSEDGSVLATHFYNSSSSELPAPIQLIDNLTGALNTTIPTPSSSPVVALAILGSYLISVSSHVHVYDLVHQNLIFSIPLNTPKRSTTHPAILTTNFSSQTFALALPLEPKYGYIPQTQTTIFAPEQARPLFTTVGNYTVTALLSERAKGGFVLIDDEAVIRRIQPSASNLNAGGVQSLPEVEMKLGLADMFGGASRNRVNTSTAADDAMAIDSEIDATSEALSSLLGNRHPEQAGLTSVSDLFSQVAKNLIGRKDSA